MAPCRWGQVTVVVLSYFLVLLRQGSTETTTPPTGERRVTIPPLIIAEPPKVLAFREHESIEMTCIASGEPEPTYSWKMNDKDFDPSGLDGRVAIQPGVGTLIFADPIERDEGIYQCFASNQVGVALTVKIDLRQAKLHPFPTGTTRSHSPQLGHPQTLRCVPPVSFPPADIFWATVATGERFIPIDLTDRITMDPEGNLHFVNILQEDERDGRTYSCIVQNSVMRSIQQGEYAVIRPQGQTVQKMAPELLWQSPTHQVALRSEIWRVKCIFSGSPTPHVDWQRMGEAMSPRARQESFGQELVIEDIQFEDAGKYECQGWSTETQTPVRRSFDLSIQSAPYWINAPESQDAAEGEKAEFFCEAAGIPEPVNAWFLNGVPITKVESDPRRVAESGKLTFYNMTKEDAQVVQCNSTNKHGYVWTNAYLNVLSEPPLIRDPPLEEQKAAEEQTIQLTCEVFGSPKPLVVWRKGSEQLTGGRFKVLEDGHLEIQDVSLVDAGEYTCSATNKFGNATASGGLIVRRKTRIQTKPLDVMVYEGTEAKFTCTSTTDPEEVRNLHIDWKKDGQIIDYHLAQRVFKNDMDNSLTISGTIALDTAKYTCMASNGLDEDEWDAQLIVQAPPDPPTDVKVLCYKNERIAEISWQPGRENYAPILNFIVQFNTSFASDTWIDIASNVSQNERLKRVSLSPWGNYTFRVLARNKIGTSPPSIRTQTICTTEPGRPEKNPENVIGEGDQPDNLVVFWTPMPKIEWNENQFWYVVSWTRADVEDAIEQKQQIDRPDQWYYEVPEKFSTPYIPFHVYVLAQNSMGPATSVPVVHMGFSGEAEPTVRPNDVIVEEDSIKATEAVLKWTHVDESPSAIRGFFRGYRIQFWKSASNGENMREQDYIINDPKAYPRPRRIRRFKRDTSPESGSTITVTVYHLPPLSEIVVQVRVLNKYYTGPPSDQIRFDTEEGQPGPPAMFDVVGRGSTHFDLQWMEPSEPNGHLKGYNISYQTITGLNLGRLQYREPITIAEATYARLTGLSPATYYRVYLSASTNGGKGEPIFLDMETLRPEPPTPPVFAVVGLNDTWVNITWELSRGGNPGSVFYVQFRPRGSYAWLHTPDEYVKNYIEIVGLDPGTTYQSRIVAKNGEGHESASEWQEFHTSGTAPGRIDLSTAAWFYGIFAALLLIIIAVVLFIVLKKYTDKWWERKESLIEEQVRQLQAEEAARQMGIVNQYAETGSRELVSESYGRDYKHSMGDEDEEDDMYSDEEYDQDDNVKGFSSDGAPLDSYAPPQYPAAGYPEPSYDGAGYPHPAYHTRQQPPSPQDSPQGTRMAGDMYVLEKKPQDQAADTFV